MMDETRDLSHVEQVIVVIRYVEKGTSTVQERLLALVGTHTTTGEALENLLVSTLERSNINIAYNVGQCYDGGSNLSRAYEGVQFKIRQRNENAIFVQCFAHSLNRAVVNAMNHKSIPGSRNFFAVLELLVVFIKAAHRIYFFLNQQSLLPKEARAEKEKETQGTRSAADGTDDEDDSCVDVDPVELTPSSPLLASTSATGIVGSATSQRTPEQDRPLAPGKGICETRWDARASTLYLNTKPIVSRVPVRTVENVIETTDDSSARATTLGLKKGVIEPRFFFYL